MKIQDRLCIGPSVMDEALKLLKNLEEKETEDHKLVLAYDETYVYVGRKNEKLTCKFTIRIPYEVPQSLLEDETAVLPYEHWECSILTFREIWKKQGFKKGDIATLCFTVHKPEEEVQEKAEGETVGIEETETAKEQVTASLMFESNKQSIPIPLFLSEGRLIYNPDKLKLEPYASHHEWMDALSHAMEVTEKEADVLVAVSPVRFMITNSKQIYYYISPSPISHWVLTRDILAILHSSIEKPVELEQKGRQVFLFEKRKGLDVLYHIILPEDTELPPVEKINFYKETQITFHINATHVRRYLENLGNISKVEVVEEGFQLRFIPHIEKDIKPVVWDQPVEDTPLLEEVYSHIKHMIMQEEEQERYIDWVELKKEINKYTNLFKKERSKDILAQMEKFVPGGDTKEMFEIWGKWIKKVKDDLYYPYKQMEEVFPILKEYEGEIRDSLFDVTQLRAFFFQKEGEVAIERRLYSDVYGKEGYLWTFDTDDRKQYVTGYTKPPVDLIGKLSELGILYYFVDDDGNLTIDEMPNHYVDEAGVIHQLDL